MTPTAPPNWVPDTQFDQAIVDAVTTNVAPFPSHVFGTLGADLHDPQNGFMNIVGSQTYGPSVTKGFLIDATAAQPTLTIGLDQPTLNSFTNVYAMNITGGVIDQLLISPEYDLIFEGTSHTLGALPTLLDTGTPPDSRLFITQGSSVDVSAYTQDGFLKDGVTITMLLNGSPYTLTSSASQKISVFGSPTDSATGGLTYGLNFFRDHQVLYNLDSNQVGIRAVPEPSAALCAVFAGVLLGMLRLTRARGRAGGGRQDARSLPA